MFLHHPFFFKDTAPTEIYTLSLHDALPISNRHCGAHALVVLAGLEHALLGDVRVHVAAAQKGRRSEERRVGKECRSGWSAAHDEKKSAARGCAMHEETGRGSRRYRLCRWCV